jgi:hypothetical protein
MAEWQLLRPYPRDRKATGLMCWPASEGVAEEIRFGRIWDSWATMDRPLYWIPCAAPGSPPSPIMRARLLLSRLLYRIWPRDDMMESFVSYYSWRIGYTLLWPLRALKRKPPLAASGRDSFAADLDDELPF